MRTLAFVLAGISVMLVTGCEGIGTAAQSKTVQGAALGTAVGAGAGAIIGNQSGHPGAGTAIGAGLGAIGGSMIGHSMEEQDQQPRLSRAVTLTKFCPVGGELYDASVQYCPIHGVELKERVP